MEELAPLASTSPDTFYAPRFQAFRDPRDGRRATLAAYGDRDGVALRLETGVDQPDEGVISPEWYLDPADADERFDIIAVLLMRHGYLPDVLGEPEGPIRFVGDPSDPARPS